MTEPFPFTNNDLSFGFPLRIELIDILDRAPVGDYLHGMLQPLHSDIRLKLPQGIDIFIDGDQLSSSGGRVKELNDALVKARSQQKQGHAAQL